MKKNTLLQHLLIAVQLSVLLLLLTIDNKTNVQSFTFHPVSRHAISNNKRMQIVPTTKTTTSNPVDVVLNAESSTSSTRQEDESNSRRRREMITAFVATILVPSTTALLGFGKKAIASEFTPGGTLVDRDVGITVGNIDASTSRNAMNSNVLFPKDFYFKFGTAAAWLPPGSAEFPKTMPFVPSQQRYDAMKKYKDRILRGQNYMINDLKKIIMDNNGNNNIEYSTLILPASDPIYYIRPFGLLANNMLASENVGEKNELLLCRWYINEMYLAIEDIRNLAKNQKDAMKYYTTLIKAMNSYYTMMNRVITTKVGEPFVYTNII